MKRLHWGCGNVRPSGWINSDRNARSGVDLPCSIEDGLPLEDDSMDCVVSVHALQEIAFDQLVTVLRELRRVLKPNGVLRLCLPDLDKAIDAYRQGRKDYFLVPDEDARSLGGKFVVHILWYGHSRIMFTFDFVEELLLQASFRHVRRCRYGQSDSGIVGITELDSRQEESLFVEAVK